MAKRPFKVHITEVFGRDVIILAEDETEASETAEEYCCNDIINVVSGDDFGDRNIEVLGVASECDKKELVCYDRDV